MKKTVFFFLGILAARSVFAQKAAPVTDRTGIYRGTVDEQLHPITLVPYGFTKVRIVAFPVVK